MNFKKLVSTVLVAVLMLSLVACGGNKDAEPAKPAEPAEPAKTTETKPEEKSDFDTSQAINVVTREEGSGTRGAFTEITGVLAKDSNGEEVDNTSVEAAVQNSTNGVMTTVSGDTYGIGYISLGSLNDSVKAVKVDGVEATADLVKSKEYKLARPFNIAWKEDNIGEIGQDLLNFILSDEGQKIAEEMGYVAVESGNKYEAAGLKGEITVSGSTSVTPLMEKCVEAYKAYNPDVVINIQSVGSTAGMTDAMEGAANLGMASRELKDKESAALQSKPIAMDGIAVITHPTNPLDDLTMEQIRQIFVGEITSWSEVE